MYDETVNPTEFL
jgi:hypothetical protein